MIGSDSHFADNYNLKVLRNNAREMTVRSETNLNVNHNNSKLIKFDLGLLNKQMDDLTMCVQDIALWHIVACRAAKQGPLRTAR